MITFGDGTAEDPWRLKTPPGSGDYEAWRDEAADPPALVVQVGKTRLSYRLRAIADAAEMLRAHGDWMELGNADEGKPVKPGTLEAWARDADNPIGGYYGLRKGYRGRFANYVAPVLELLGLAELEHKPRGNRLRARLPDAD
ncbi:MAG: DUF6855 family protein [Pseudomonadota bacterium]